MKNVKHLILVLAVSLVAYAPETLAASRKLLINSTKYPLTVILTIRSGDDLRITAGTKDFTLAPMQQLHVEYGDHKDIYLNGIRVSVFHDGEFIETGVRVISRGSHLDNILNSFDQIVISAPHDAFMFDRR